METKDGLTTIVCQECGYHFLVAEVDRLIKCADCGIISRDKDTFMTLENFIEEGKEWY